MVVTLPPPTVPHMLKEAAKLKIDELHHAKDLFVSRLYAGAAASAGEGPVLERLNHLLDWIKEQDPYLEHDNDLSILTRLVTQAQYDRSISEPMLLKLSGELVQKMKKHARRLEISAMHAELLKEVLDAAQSGVSLISKGLEYATLDDDFEVVEKELEYVLDDFEKNAFGATNVDVIALEQYLDNLFASEFSRDVLQRMRSVMQNFGFNTTLGYEEVDENTVKWCIEDLLTNPLLSDEKRITFQGYLQSDLALRELTGTLNAKSIRHWNYRHVEQGLPVTARQNAEGRYCITVEEDIVDTLFLHTVAVSWSMKFKNVMRETLSCKETWGHSVGNPLSAAEYDGRRYWTDLAYYEGVPPPPMPVPMPEYPPAVPFNEYHPPPRRRGTFRVPPPPRKGAYRTSIPPPAPQAPVYQRRNPRKKYARRSIPPPAPMLMPSDIAAERHRNYARHFFLSRLPKLYGSSPVQESSSETQSQLLKTLILEAKLRLALDGSVHGVAANFQSFASSLPHQTILTVLKFVGVPQQWLDVFSRFLNVPLNMGPVVRGTGDRILTRVCGVPVGHGLEAFFGEAILFFLDMAVHQKTESHVYRLRDKCYFVGPEQQCDNVSAEISKFATIMGLQVTFNEMKEEPIGLMNFTASGNSVFHDIDTTRVKSYAFRVRQCLSKCTTMIEWIRTWNATMGTYAAHLFGPLANLFGKDHLKAVTQAYNLMHQIVIPGQELTSHIKTLLRAHVRHDLLLPETTLEAIIHLPHVYGGLGIGNPYNAISLASQILDNPMAEFESFLATERRYYEETKQRFETMTPAQQAKKLSFIFNDDEKRMAAALGDSADRAVFPTEALMAHRERLMYTPYSPPPSLAAVYSVLMYEPCDFVVCSEKIINEVQRLAGELEMKRWSALSSGERWVLQVYGEECLETYGGLAIWHGESVPREALRMARGETDDISDDESSVSSSSTVMSEV